MTDKVDSHTSGTLSDECRELAAVLIEAADRLSEPTGGTLQAILGAAEQDPA